MKAIITIIVLALVAWGVWWFVNRGDSSSTPTGDNTSEVQGAADVNAGADVDLGEFDSKG